MKWSTCALLALALGASAPNAFADASIGTEVATPWTVIGHVTVENDGARSELELLCSPARREWSDFERATLELHRFALRQAGARIQPLFEIPIEGCGAGIWKPRLTTMRLRGRQVALVRAVHCSDLEHIVDLRIFDVRGGLMATWLDDGLPSGPWPELFHQAGCRPELALDADGESQLSLHWGLRGSCRHEREPDQQRTPTWVWRDGRYRSHD